MDEGAASDTVTPDLRDVEVKIGRKTPEGLLRWMREEAPSVRGDARLSAAHELGKETGRKSLDEKIRKLRVEMTHLRSLDVRILQQLLVVHEGIEAVKWLLEERSTLTSRCSSLTSSLYSLGEGPDTSWRGSWSSLQDPNDRLDNVSIGSYLDTLADDLDEYCPSSSESVICSMAEAGGRTAGGPGATVPAAGPAAAAGMRSGTLGAKLIRLGANENGSGPEVSGDSGTGGASEVTGAESTPAKTEGPKRETTVWTKAPEAAKARLGSKAVNGILEKPAAPTGSPTGSPSRSSQSPKPKASKSGKVDLDTCKMNGRRHLEYDAHWRWVQSQEDVTFL